jgi:hypothetical protein
MNIGMGRDENDCRGIWERRTEDEGKNRGKIGTEEKRRGRGEGLYDKERDIIYVYV